MARVHELRQQSNWNQWHQWMPMTKTVLNQRPPIFPSIDLNKWKFVMKKNGIKKNSLWLKLLVVSMLHYYLIANHAVRYPIVDYIHLHMFSIYFVVIKRKSNWIHRIQYQNYYQFRNRIIVIGFRIGFGLWVTNTEIAFICLVGFSISVSSSLFYSVESVKSLVLT